MQTDVRKNLYPHKKGSEGGKRFADPLPLIATERGLYTCQPFYSLPHYRGYTRFTNVNIYLNQV